MLLEASVLLAQFKHKMKQESKRGYRFLAAPNGSLGIVPVSVSVNVFFHVFPLSDEALKDVLA